MQFGEAAQLRRYLPAQADAREIQSSNAPVVVDRDAVPFAEGSVAQPVVALIPVLTIRCIVEGNQRFRSVSTEPEAASGAVAAAGATVAVGAASDSGVVGVGAGEAVGDAVAAAGATVAVGAASDSGVVGVGAGEAGVSVGMDAVRSGPVTPDGSSEPQAASAAVRARRKDKAQQGHVSCRACTGHFLFPRCFA